GPADRQAGRQRSLHPGDTRLPGSLLPVAAKESDPGAVRVLRPGAAHAETAARAADREGGPRRRPEYPAGVLAARVARALCDAHPGLFAVRRRGLVSGALEGLPAEVSRSAHRLISW